VPALKEVDVVRIRAGNVLADSDRAAAEEPLEIRLHGRPFAVIMRTPGADRELTAGFLLAERVLQGADDLGTIEHCRDKTDATGRFQTAENVVNVTLTGGSLDALDRVLAERRQTMTTSACGLCGRQTIESLQEAAPPLAPAAMTARIAASAVSRLPHELRRAQAVFDETGGLHAAGLFDAVGTLIGFAEDVGRHNAVDKVVGRMLMQDALPLSSAILFVSGRTSFEIVQKALLAGIPIVASVSAPSSLAIELAREAGITLIGFVRGDGLNIYAHAERVER
jgi:FdhD protein